MSYICKIPITTSFTKRLEMLNWAKKHCPSYITNDVDKTDILFSTFRFYFSDEKDYTMFTLRWA